MWRPSRLTSLRLVALVALLSTTLVLGACRASSPAGGPEATCARACEQSASQCSSSQCARGCNLVLDRLAEREGGHVVACVAASSASSASSSACDDRVWSRCATRIGPHADGGPPPPPAPSDDEIEGD